MVECKFCSQIHSNICEEYSTCLQHGLGAVQSVIPLVFVVLWHVHHVVSTKCREPCVELDSIQAAWQSPSVSMPSRHCRLWVHVVLHSEVKEEMHEYIEHPLTTDLPACSW
jgi:hypothetical protein